MQTSKLYQDVLLTKIAPNPKNPRQNFAGENFDELVASVAVKGVIVPILLRPMPDKRKKQEFEIVFGERRWRAACAVAEKNGGMKKATVPAIVRDLTDEEAFDAMIIENLQREDLTELEEAQSFQSFLEKKGPDAIPELAERVGKHPRYIQRRVAVLGLPGNVLKSWEEGKIKYGHCEQLIRLKDPVEIKTCLKKLLDDNRYREVTVRDLQRTIDQSATELDWAKFNLEEEGCLECRHNSDVQKELFGDVAASKTARCLDSSCFRSKQGKWLTKNWKKFAKQIGTNGFRFSDAVKWNEHNEFEEWSRQPGEKCSECPDFISLVGLRGKMEHKQSCIGKKSCYDSMPAATRNRRSQKTSAEKQKDKTEKDGPRVDWHGAYFREQFYHERIDAVLRALKVDHVYVLRAALFSILKSNGEARQQFARDARMLRQDQLCIHVSDGGSWDKIMQLDVPTLKEEIKKAAIRIVLQSNHMSSMLNRVCDHIGIDLAREWRLNRDYLEKKTIGEIHEIGEKHGIFADEKAQVFLHEILGKKRGKYGSCKKEELIRVILESGVDLAGKVPEEILDLRTRHERDLEAEGLKECETCGGMCSIDNPEDPDEEIDCPDCKGEGTLDIPEAANGAPKHRS